MNSIQWESAKSVENAVQKLEESGKKARVCAGGTDLTGGIKEGIYPDGQLYKIISLDEITGKDSICEADGWLRIGALTKLEDLGENDLINRNYFALGEAARNTASDHLRKKGTIAGNICQDNRCWYFRAEGNQYNCLRKGGHYCYAAEGENEFHSIFGAMRTKELPCRHDCPSGIDIPDYMARIRKSDFKGAAEILLENNPLAAMTGRVCPHFCEMNCNRAATDEAVSIREVERYLGDYILNHSEELLKVPSVNTKKKIAVIGGGPAGLSASFFLRRKGHEVTVFESQKEAGGMLRYAIPAYRLPKNIVQKQVHVLSGMGIEIKNGIRVGKDVQLERIMDEYDAVLLACGAWKGRSTGIKGEEFMLSGLNLLREIADGRKEIPEKRVAVLGGGNTAMDVVRTLKRMGADARIIYRRTRAEMPAISHDVDKAIEEGICMDYLTQPLEVSRNTDGNLTLTCSRMELGESDASGRRRPVPVAGSEFLMEFDAVVTAFGETADTGFIEKEYLNEKGGLAVNDGYVGRNLFAGGDYVSGPSTVTEAMDSGKKAARAIDAFLGGKEEKVCSRCIGLPRMDEHTPRIPYPELPPAERTQNIDGEDVCSLAEREAAAEANRCLNCACVAVNCSDLAPALVAFHANIITNKRIIPAEKFWSVKVPGSTALDADELVIEIRIPKPAEGTKSAFLKYAARETIDFPVLNCAAVISADDACICMNAVKPVPVRAFAAEDVIRGKKIDEAIAGAAAEEAVHSAERLENNTYKISMAKAIVKRTIMACRQEA